ncbi:hypothetical protein U9M48_031513 [Paspalum notatum var. saurae]|uniref:Reverse transcriptase/retrotransposon-derived protein RNase H-like domain-containing protein n=1 Tax=Paspalum notatum var. saurae TaxID=547442 RepID=A0AAQ3U364_PASNO
MPRRANVSYGLTKYLSGPHSFQGRNCGCNIQVDERQDEKAFDELKKRLTTAPILVLHDPAKKFTVSCDASKEGLGCVRCGGESYRLCFSAS